MYVKIRILFSLLVLLFLCSGVFISLNLGNASNPIYSSSCLIRPMIPGPRNIILLIGDGMGINHILATLLVYGPLNLTLFNTTGLAFTYSANRIVTDSAAAGSALATGFRTFNRMVSMVQVNGVNKNVTTILEIAKKLNMSTGLVSTTSITDATPAAFAAHVPDRALENEIAVQLIEREVDVILDGGKRYFPQDLLEIARKKGYAIVYSRDELAMTPFNTAKLLGLFSDIDIPCVPERTPQIPSLLDMTIKAIEVLQNNPCGFFLMVEGGRIDHAAHENRLDLVVAEAKEFDDVVGSVLSYATRRGDTLVVVMADHETGGLLIEGGNVPSTINLPFSARWGSTEYTAQPVVVFAYGPGAEVFAGVYHIRDVAKKSRD